MFVKTEASLKRLLTELDRIEDESIPRIQLRTNTLAYNTDLVDALDAPDMVDAARLIAHAALSRNESRGPHFREDYPRTDNDQWLKQIVVSMQGRDVTTRLEPIKQKYLKPPRGQFDYLADPYV